MKEEPKRKKEIDSKNVCGMSWTVLKVKLSFGIKCDTLVMFINVRY